jgi:DNA-binding MarR family transcriptional regulator
VQRLVRKGLLQKRRSRQDIRAFALRLTDEGQQLLKDAEPVARNIDAALLRALPPARREPFLEALRAITSRLEG